MTELSERVRSLLAEGRKIEAIKVYREATSAGLKEAKDAVEALDRDGEFPAVGPLGPGVEREIASLLEQNEKIEAIRVYRERTGADLKTAKDAVEALAGRQGIAEKGAGCAGILFLGVTIPIAIIIIRIMA